MVFTKDIFKFMKRDIWYLR